MLCILHVERIRYLQTDSSDELGKVRCAETGDGIPAGLRGEAVGAASRVVAGGDVVERSGARGGVEEGVEEAQGRLARGDEAVVEQRHDAREDRARARGARDGLGHLVDDDLDVLALGGDVGEGAPGGVELARVGRAERGEVGRDRGRLVRWACEDVGEAAG